MPVFNYSPCVLCVTLEIVYSVAQYYLLGSYGTYCIFVFAENFVVVIQ